ncbi:MAG: CHASE2 domain-containing protein [Ignavibacteriaceae bacterium]|nr:CHASE2 domain-containing protein [Ignavibacteriaceae bacterium]
MNKSFFHLRYFIITLLMFIVLGIFSFLPINCFFLDPITKAISDFDVYDIVYSKLREDPKADTSIVIVNIGNLSRLEIANQINIINSYNPKLIAVDAIFEEAKDYRGDSSLAMAFSKCKNLVLVSRLEGFSEISETYDTLICSIHNFSKYGTTGFANLPNDDKLFFRTIREFRPKAKSKGKTIPAFSAKIAEIFNPDAYKYLEKRENEIEKINFIGNYEKFYHLDTEQLIAEDQNLNFLRDKIILMGFVGTSFQNKTLEDIYFTPLNERYAGKSFPDMYGVVIHANIISMILNKSYVNKMPSWMSVGIALFMSYLSAFIIYTLKIKYKDWFSGLSKIYILLITVFNLLAGVLILHYFNYRIDLTLALAVVILTNTIVEIYQSYISKIFPSLEK